MKESLEEKKKEKDEKDEKEKEKEKEGDSKKRRRRDSSSSSSSDSDDEREAKRKEKPRSLHKTTSISCAIWLPPSPSRRSRPCAKDMTDSCGRLSRILLLIGGGSEGDGLLSRGT